MGANDSSLVLVTGATGAVGPLVVKALCDAGYHVRTLSIDRPPADMWPDGVEARTGDVTNAGDVESAMDGVGSVIHLAALLHIVNVPSELYEAYEKVNVGGTSTVVTAALKSGVKRIVFFSTIAVYGQSAGRVLTEETDPRPETFYAQTKLAGETIVLDAKSIDGGRIGTVLRLGAVYGSRIKGNYLSLANALARGRFIPIGKGQNRRTLIYDKDVAKAAVLAMRDPGAAGKVFNVSDGEFHTVNDIVLNICKALGRKPPRFSVPIGLVRFVVGILEDLTRAVRLKTRINRAMVDKYTEDIAVDSGHIHRELGFVPQYDLTAGWAETIIQMRQSGYL